MNQFRLVTAAVLVALATLPAPPVHAFVAVTGTSCGLAGSNDETGVVYANPDTYGVEVTGGPVAVLGDRPTELHVECVLVGPDGPVSGWRQTLVDGDGVLVELRAFSLLHQEPLEICTSVWWRSGGTISKQEVDLDPAAAGVQCAPAQVGAGHFPWVMPRRYVVPVVFVEMP